MVKIPGSRPPTEPRMKRLYEHFLYALLALFVTMAIVVGVALTMVAVQGL